MGVTPRPGWCHKHLLASTVELKGWGSWRNIRRTGITLEEAKQLVCMTKARLEQEDLNLFDWELTDSRPRNT